MGNMLESIYFPCYYSFLVGDIVRAQMYYDVLREEFSANGSLTALPPHYLEQLAIIRDALRIGFIPAKKWLTEETPFSLPAAGAPVNTVQKDLVKDIHTWGFLQLQRLLEDESLYLYNLEHPCLPYGYVDMVYRGKSTAYPIEVKKDCGEHDLVGQIGKYDLHHRLNLHLKHYDFVRSVTICRTYQPYALQELKAMGIMTLIYTGTGRTLSITRV